MIKKSIWHHKTFLVLALSNKVEIQSQTALKFLTIVGQILGHLDFDSSIICRQEFPG
jgi:hypothetical protein